MTVALDLVGHVYGLLTPLRISRKTAKSIYWECQCACGNKTECTTGRLRSGWTRSCGCLKSAVTSARNRLNKGVPKQPIELTALIGLYADYRANARVRGLEFSLTREEVKELIDGHCFYCNVEPLQQRKCPGGIVLYNGIDRLDNTKGYYLDNVVSCCRICNVAKNNMTMPEWNEWLSRIVKHWKDRM